MEIGSMIAVEYNNGKLYSGVIVSVKKMHGYRTMFVLRVDNGYKSLYLDKCVTCEYIGFVNA
jgi:hypothetical protein